MTAGDLIQDALGVLSIAAIVVGAARFVWRYLQKSKQREIDERVGAALDRRAKDQEDGTPVEKELRRQLAELKRDAARDREAYRRDLSKMQADQKAEITSLRAEHDREIADIRNRLTSEVESLRGQLTEAYRTRPNATGGTA